MQKVGKMVCLLNIKKYVNPHIFNFTKLRILIHSGKINLNSQEQEYC